MLKGQPDHTGPLCQGWTVKVSPLVKGDAYHSQRIHSRGHLLWITIDPRVFSQGGQVKWYARRKIQKSYQVLIVDQSSLMIDQKRRSCMSSMIMTRKNHFGHRHTRDHQRTEQSRCLQRHSFAVQPPEYRSDTVTLIMA